MKLKIDKLYKTRGGLRAKVVSRSPINPLSGEAVNDHNRAACIYVTGTEGDER